MTPMKSVTVATALMIALAACGSGGSGNTPADRIADAPRLTDARITRELRSLERQFAGATPTRYADLPQNGTATYNGLVGAEIRAGGESTDLVGRAAIDVNFSDESVTGSLGRFFTSDKERLSGSLSLRRGIIASDMRDPITTLRSDVRGRLTTPDGQAIRLEGTLRGGFLNGTEGTGGEISGRAVVEDDVGRFDGGLILGRN